MRKAAVAGSFYPSDPSELEDKVRRFLDKPEETQVKGDIFALMVPHAGYDYSGQVAGFAYYEIADRSIETFILLGPSHRTPLEGISIFSEGSFETPLGTVPIDEELGAKFLAEHPTVAFKPEAHRSEHSLEVQLPFLQVLFKNFKILPIEIGHPLDRNSMLMAGILKKYFDPSRHLILASSDMSHFHDYDTARKLDLPTLLQIENINIEGTIEHLVSGKGELCGEGAVITTLLVARNLGAKARFLRYENSGDITGERSSVVGYGAVAFYLEKGPQSSQPSTECATSSSVVEEKEDTLVSPQDRDYLLKASRKILNEYITTGKIPTLTNEPPLMKEKLGLFVTLRRHGELRGCIGYIIPQKPLGEALVDMTISSSTQDTRFRPVQSKELKDISVEISILSPLKKITDPDSIVMGKHGVYVKKGYRSGVFLPQVADETGWDRDTFMDHLCSGKAGLPAKAWRDKDTEIYVFTVEHFEEEHPG